MLEPVQPVESARWWQVQQVTDYGLWPRPRREPFHNLPLLQSPLEKTEARETQDEAD